MPILESGKNLMLTELASVVTHVALHTDDPGSTGASNEATGGSPAYARQAVTWDTASGGAMTDTGTDPEWDVPAGTYTHWSGWTASTSGTCHVTQEINAGDGITVLQQDTITATQLAINLNAAS